MRGILGARCYSRAKLCQTVDHEVLIKEQQIVVLLYEWKMIYSLQPYMLVQAYWYANVYFCAVNHIHLKTPWW